MPRSCPYLESRLNLRFSRSAQKTDAEIITSAGPARRPWLACPSLESYGIQVSELAARCGMKYINGASTITYFGAVLK